MTSLNAYIQNNPLPTTANNVPPTSIEKAGNFATKNVINPVKDAFSGAVNQVKSGYGETQAPGNPLQKVDNLISGGAHMAEGALGAIASPLAPVLQRPVGAGVNMAGNALADSYGPDVQQGLYEGGQTGAEKTLSATNTIGNIMGGVAGLEGVASLGSNIWDRAYGKATAPSGVDMATQQLENQSKSAVNAQQNIDTSVNQFQKGLGETFGEAPKQIEQINPNAKVTLPSEVIDRLNALKDTKKFALPDYLRTSSPEFGDNIKLGDIEKCGVSLSPSDAQDLITKLNKLTYAAKASGDLEINQSTIGLNKDIHSLANNAFGDIKDTTGNSIWGKAYENYSKGVNAVDKISDIFNSDKMTTASDFNKTMNTIKSLSKDPQGKMILQNALEEFKQTSGIDLTNPTAEIGKILDSEEFLKEAQKPSFLAKTFDKTYMSKILVRVTEMAIFGGIIRGIIKNVNQ